MRETGHIADSIANELPLYAGSITRRKHKTNVSIVQKLQREKTELSRMQDIAGCRVVVPTIMDLHDAVGRIELRYADARTVDRLQTPRNGYRAIHILLKNKSYTFEVQLRTRLQHDWAELSERLADRYGVELKYGGGPEHIVDFLLGLSATISAFEAKEPDSILDYVDGENWERDPDALEGSPELGAARGEIASRIEGALRFLRD